MSEASRRSDALSAKRRANLADWAGRQGAKQPRLDTLFRVPAPVAVAAPAAEQVPSTAQRRTAAVDVAYERAQAALRDLGAALAMPDRAVGVPVAEGVEVATGATTTPDVGDADVDDADADDYDVPNLSGSSIMELEHVAHLGNLFHRCGLSSTPVSAKALAGWLLAGKRALRTDARFDLDLVGLDVFYELDPGVTHDHRIEDDLKKTRCILATYPDAVLLRLRWDAVPLPVEEDPRLRVVHTSRLSASACAAAVAHALAPFASGVYRDALATVRPQSSAAADAAAHALRLRMDTKYRAAVQALFDVVDNDHDARRLLNTGGIKERLANGDVPAILRRLRDDYKVHLSTLVSHCVAARFDDPPALYAVLDTLRTKYDIQKLQTFVCGGVAARFDDPLALYAILDTLQTKYDIQKLQTFVCNGVAARFDDPPALYAILDTLQTKYGIQNLQTFVCSAVAARFDDPPALYAVLDTLRTKYGIQKLQTFMCDSVAARFDDPPALYAILDTLRDTYKVKSLQTFVCNGVATRFDDPPTLYAILDTLRDTYKVESLQTFMCNCVAARFDDPPALYAVLDTLRTKYDIQKLQTFVCGGVAARFDDPPALYAILDTLLDTYKVKSLQTFMCNGVAARFGDPSALYTILDQLKTSMGGDGVMLCSGNNAFASRLELSGFLDTVLSIASHLHTRGVPPGPALRKVLHTANKRLMDKLDIFYAKIRACADGELSTFLHSLRNHGRTKGNVALRARIDSW